MSSSSPAADAALEWLRQHARTEPSDSYEAVALAMHAILVHHDFRPSNIAPGENGAAALPADWGRGGYGGQYRHERSAMLFDIRAVRMGGRLLINAVANEDDTRLNTVDVRVENYYTTDVGDDSWVSRLNDLSGLCTLVAVQIAHKLVPETGKRGYEHNTGEEANTNTSNSGSTSSSQQPPSQPPYRPDPSNEPLRIDPLRDPRYNPLRDVRPLGHDDLLPPGLPHPGAFNPLMIPPGRGGQPTRGGNLMGPDHFQNMTGPRRPPGVPPGARFDPYGVNPDPDGEALPGFDDDHRLRQGFRPPPRGPSGGGGFNDDGPPPGMFF